MVKKEAERISYGRILEAAQSKLKLCGGAVTEREDEIKPKTRKKRDRKDGDDQQNALLLRKKTDESDDVPQPKRRNIDKEPSFKEPEETIEKSNGQQSQTQDIVTDPLGCLADIVMEENGAKNPADSKQEQLSSKAEIMAGTNISEKRHADFELIEEKRQMQNRIGRPTTTEPIFEAEHISSKKPEVKERESLSKHLEEVPTLRRERERERDRTTEHSQAELTRWKTVPPQPSIPQTYKIVKHPNTVRQRLWKSQISLTIKKQRGPD